MKTPCQSIIYNETTILDFFDSYRTVPLSFRVSLVERDFRGGLKMMNSVLATLRESLFAQSQIKRDLRSAFIFVRSSFSHFELNFRYVSSAKWYVEELLIAWCISLIYIRKRRGPRIDPCGTPQVTSWNFELEFLNLTHCFLSVK